MNRSDLGWKSFLEKAIKFKNENNLSYQDIGEAISTDRSHVNRIFRGHTSPSVEIVLKLSEYMGIPLHVLFLPSEDIITQVFLEQVKHRIEELNWNPDKLANVTGLSVLRLNDLLKGNELFIEEERIIISKVLDVENDQFNSIESNRVQLLMTLLSDWGLNTDQKVTILDYIKRQK